MTEPAALLESRAEVVAAPESHTAGRPGRGPLGWVAAGAVYLLVACLLYWPVAPWDGHQVLQSAGYDAAQTVWYLKWMAWAVGHGANPFFTTAVDVPHGANIATNTSVPLIGWLGAPITWIWGPITTFNLAMRIGVAGSAFTMFLFLRRWVRWWPAAFLGGALYGFNSFALQESATHLHLTFLVVPPLILWALDELLVSRSRRPVPTGVVLGLLLVAQWFINEEVLFGCLFFAVIGLIVLGLARRSSVGPALRRAMPGLVVGALVFVVLVAYPLWFLVAGPQHLKGPTQARWIIAQYREDLFSPVWPTITETSRASAQIVAQYHPPRRVFQWSATAGYVGIPLVVALVALTISQWRKPIVRFASLMAAITFVLALGGTLTVLGHNTGIPLPAAVFSHLPLLYEVLPQRLAIFTWLFMAIVLAAGLGGVRDRLGDRPPSWLRMAAGRPTLIAGAVLVFVAGSFAPMFVAGPKRVTTAVPDGAAAAIVARHTPRGGIVLFLPAIRNYAVTPMLWQAQADLAYRTVGGYVIVPRTTYSSSQYPHPTPALAQVYAAVPTIHRVGPRTERPTQVNALHACKSLPTVIRQYAVSSVVVWSAPQTDLSYIERGADAALGPPPLRRGGLMMWDRVASRERGLAACRSLRSG